MAAMNSDEQIQAMSRERLIEAIELRDSIITNLGEELGDQIKKKVVALSKEFRTSLKTIRLEEQAGLGDTERRKVYADGFENGITDAAAAIAEVEAIKARFANQQTEVEQSLREARAAGRAEGFAKGFAKGVASKDAQQPIEGIVQ